jgi:acyl dehydratase
MGDNPLDEDELAYVYEGRDQSAVPSMCVTLGWPPLWIAEPQTGIAWTKLFDTTTGERLANLRATEFLRGDGGCGSHGTPPSELAPLDIQMQPTASIEYRTSGQAALLYRLVSRDYMPIHADPVIAGDAGFDKPISHGLNTMGLACRAILKHFVPRRPELIRTLSVRFVSPAFPGYTIRVEMFGAADIIRFRAWAVERQVLVLDRGQCWLAQE